jgi:hypothetical protein
MTLGKLLMHFYMSGFPTGCEIYNLITYISFGVV